MKVLNISNVSRVTSCSPNLDAGMKGIRVFFFTSEENMFPLKYPVKQQNLQFPLHYKALFFY